MRADIKIGVFTIFLFLGTLLPQKSTAQVAVNYQVFYDNLSPYGYWVNNPNYGYVWVPEVSGFTPYRSNGHWVYTNVGWTWVSDYSWGWAPFHYGRWYHDSLYGWAWVPGTQWGPGWVTWRNSDSYYGWAPIGPETTIQKAYSSDYILPHNQWTFVRHKDFGRPSGTNYYVNTSNNVTIINNTTIINNIRKDKKSNINYYSGPNLKEVQTRTGKNFNPVTINDKKSAGQKAYKNQLQLYRPKVNKNGTSGKKPVPAKVTNPKNIKSQPHKVSKTKAAKQQNVKSPQNNQKTKEQQVKKLNNKKAIQQQTLQEMNNRKAEQQRLQKMQAVQQQEQNNQRVKQLQEKQEQSNQRAKQLEVQEKQRKVQKQQDQQQAQQPQK